MDVPPVKIRPKSSSLQHTGPLYVRESRRARRLSLLTLQVKCFAIEDEAIGAEKLAY